MDTSVSLLDSLRAPSNDGAWQLWCELYSPLLRKWALRYGATASDVDDLVQEVMVVVVRRIGEFERQPRAGAFRSWLRTITVNCLRDLWKRRRFRAVARGGSDFAAVLDQLTDPHSGVSRIWDQEFETHILRCLLDRIKPRFSEKIWEAFERFALGGQSADDVASALQMSPNAVFIAKSRVMTTLREFGRGLIDATD